MIISNSIAMIGLGQSYHLLCRGRDIIKTRSSYQDLIIVRTMQRKKQANLTIKVSKGGLEREELEKYARKHLTGDTPLGLGGDPTLCTSSTLVKIF